MINPTPTCPDGYEFRDCGCFPLPPQSEPVWTDLGVVPQIAASPTALARIICQIQPYGGELFLGYGDWDQTVQPGCDLLSYDPVSSSFKNYGHYETDAIWSIRQVGADLVALMTDPEVGTNPDMVFVKPDNTTQLVAESWPNPWHLFDAVEFKGQRYVCGAISIDGSTNAPGVWGTYLHAPTGQTRWKVVYQGASTTAISRAYALWVLGDSMYVSTSNGRVYVTTDGLSWAYAFTGVSLAHKPMPWRDGVVYRAGWPASSYASLYYSDGTYQVVDQTSVRDHFSDGNTLAVLKYDGMIRLEYAGLSDVDLITGGPANAISVAMLDGAIYVGTRDSHVWRYA